MSEHVMSEHAGSPTSSRRSLLKTGGLVAAGAAFLAACSPDHQMVGVSGDPVVPTSNPPAVPDPKLTDAVIAANQSQLHTLASVEALVAEVYGKNAGTITDGELREAAVRFGQDHEAAAKALVAATEDKVAPPPNEELRAAMVTPMQGLLKAQEHILPFMQDLESTLAATYITAVSVLSEAGDRQLMMSYGAACARRVTVLGRGGEGEMPQAARFPTDHLIPGAAYLDLVAEAGDSPEDDSADDEPDE